MRISKASELRNLALAILAISWALFGSVALVRAHSPDRASTAKLDRAIAADPESAALHLSRGQVHHLNLEWGNALTDFDRAAALDPELEGIDRYRARTLLASRRPAEALAVLERILSRRPQDPFALALRGRVLSELGRMDEAARAFDAAVAAHPRPDSRLFLDRALAQSAQAEVAREEVLRGLDEGIAKLGPLVTLQLPAIELERQLARFDAALARVDTLARQSRRQDPWLTLRGEILVDAGRDVEARQALLAARNALEALPPKRRSTRAAEKLADRIDRASSRLSATAVAKGQSPSGPGEQ